MQFQLPSDEELVRRVKQESNPDALEALIIRYWDRINALVAGQLLRLGFKSADIEDAQQTCLIGVAKSIPNFNLEQLRGSGPCQVRTFVGMVVMRRLGHFLRKFRCRERRERNCVPVAILEVSAGRVCWSTCRESPDPVSLAERHEEQERLERFL